MALARVDAAIGADEVESKDKSEADAARTSEGLIANKVWRLLYSRSRPCLHIVYENSAKKMATPSRKAKRRLDPIEGRPGQPLQISTPSVAPPAKKRKLDETDVLATGTMAESSQAHSTNKPTRKLKEFTQRRWRQKARLLQGASMRIQIDEPAVALPTLSSVQEEHVEDDNPKGEGVGELTKLCAELAAKDEVRPSRVLLRGCKC